MFGVWLLDYKLHVDDPVGAVAVHFMNGIWGTIAVGLFATTSAPGNDTLSGLFYGGGFTALGTQLLGVVAVCAFAGVTITMTFAIIEATLGLRCKAEEEVAGLDVSEHGLTSAYADFALASSINNFSEEGPVVLPDDAVPIDEAIPVQLSSTPKSNITEVPHVTMASDTNFTQITILAKQNRFEELKNAMEKIVNESNGGLICIII